MPRMPEFHYHVKPGNGEDQGPIVHVWGIGFQGPFDEEYECWPKIPARAVSAIDVVEIQGTKMPIADVEGAISRLLCTHRPKEVPVEGSDNGEMTTKWEPTEEVERFHTLVYGNIVTWSGEELGDIYSDLVADLGQRPTSRSRR